MKPTPTPSEFVKSCQNARPTHHLFGWGSKQLGEMVQAQMDESAYLRCQVQLLNSDSAESHTEIESMIVRLGLSLPDTDCLPDHAELAKVLQAEVVRLRGKVDQLRDEVADAKK